MVVRLLFCAVLVFASFQSAFGAATLTGLIQFSANGSGLPSGEVWNTLGGDSNYNLYVNYNATYLNSGDGAGASVSLVLTPGIYTFVILGEPGNIDTYSALNLFFDGNNTNPGISVIQAAGGPGFSANGNSTLALNGAAVAGANSLVYNGSGSTVTLLDYGWFPAIPVGNFDSVSSFDNVPSGLNDMTGYIVLDVAASTQVPEPGTLSVAALGVVALVAGRLRRR
jgi:hypothetical protein